MHLADIAYSAGASTNLELIDAQRGPGTRRPRSTRREQPAAGQPSTSWRPPGVFRYSCSRKQAAAEYPERYRAGHPEACTEIFHGREGPRRERLAPNMLRYSADRRTLAWAVAMPVVALIPYLRPELAGVAVASELLPRAVGGVIAHNHNHCPTFRDRKLNAVFGNWLSIFYGYPTFAWIPTHNLNHHKFVNKAGRRDHHLALHQQAQRAGGGDLLLRLELLPVGADQGLHPEGEGEEPRAVPDASWPVRLFGGTHVALLVAGRRPARLADGVPRVGPDVPGIPAFFALWTIMLFNYIQHVHTDPWSEHNHSRSFDRAAAELPALQQRATTPRTTRSPARTGARCAELHAKARPGDRPAG